MKLTAEDIEQILETIQGLQHPQPEGPHGTPCGESRAACTYPACDCFGSETIMLSGGYAEAYQTGEVVANGRTIYRCD